MEAVTSAIATPRAHRPSVTSIGTVLALQSVTLRNELAGTVRRVALTPGQIVENGTVLVALDVAVEMADLKAREAQLVLAETTLSRLQRLLDPQAVSAEEVDRARAERDVAQAEIARIRAIIERKTIRAPFRARIGISDVHTGQYLSEGTVLTTLQSIDASSNVDFTVAQNVAARLEVGDTVLILTDAGPAQVPARIAAIDSRVDPVTRNAAVRARIADSHHDLTPGASVRVQIPSGESIDAVAVPVKGQSRVHVRPILAGEVLGDEVLILRGLQAGEQVAASGAFKLREGALIALADSAATKNGQGGK
jgi:membrane fusion protein (multidrug efflux system)